MRLPISLRALGTIAALLLLLTSLPAAAETFGRTTVGTTPSGALRADFKRGSKFALSEAGTATSLCAWLDTKGGTDMYQTFRFVLYRDVNGAPGAKLAQTADGLFPPGYDGRWICSEIAWTPLSAGNYWLMIHTGGPNAPGPLRYFYDGPANFVGNHDNFQDSAADPAGAVDSGNGTVSIYATYIPATRLSHAGKTIVGGTPSGGLRDDFKRGSSFTIPQAGKVTALTAYLDAGGTSSAGSQAFRFALYDDVNGVPTHLVARSIEMQLPNTVKPRWYTIPVSDGVIPAGKYWFMIQSGSGAGLLRYAFDGTGNWYGNADAFPDGITPTFGPGSAGDGTMSAYISFEPGTSVTRTMGYTYAGNIVTKTYGSGEHHASRYTLVKSGATINGLYAYIDGLGGASGSEQVRLAVWSDQSYADGSPGNHFPFALLAVSNIVAVNAGQAPGWVRFDIPPTAVPPGDYWISLQVGPANGIVRLYSDNNGEDVFNYQGDFANGPTGFINSDGEIQGGSMNLSVYATYTTN